jgi:hypothetical protein
MTRSAPLTRHRSVRNQRSVGIGFGCTPSSDTEIAQRMGVTQGRVSAIEHAKSGATELRTLASYAEALGGRLEIIADFGDKRLAFAEPGTEAA